MERWFLVVKMHLEDAFVELRGWIRGHGHECNGLPSMRSRQRHRPETLWNRFFVPRLFNVLQALRLSFYSTLGCSLLKDLCLVFIWWSGHSSFTWCSVFWTSGSWGFYMLQFGMHFCLEDFIYDLVINILVLTPRHFCVAGVLRFFRWKFWGTMGCFAEQWLWRYCDYTDFLIVFLPMMCWFLQNAAIQ